MQPNLPDQTTNPRGFGGTPDPAPAENEDGSVDATEAEQMQYDMLTVRARKMIFGKGKEKILTMLGSSESPSKAIGQAGAMIMKALWQAAKKQGTEIASDVMIEAATEVADDLNELGKAKGIFKYDDQKSEDEEMEQAILWGIKFYGDGMVQSGEITPEIQKAAQEETARGIESEGGPKRKPIAEGVNKAMGPQSGMQPQGGLVGGQMPAAGGM